MGEAWGLEKLKANITGATSTDIDVIVAMNGKRDISPQDYSLAVCSLGNVGVVCDRTGRTDTFQAPAINDALFAAMKGPRVPDYIIIVDDDIDLPAGWDQAFIHAHETLRRNGIKPGHGGLMVDGSNWTEDLRRQRFGDVEIFTAPPRYPATIIIGGVRFYSRELVGAAGFVSEDYPEYGYEDCDYCVRAHHLGFTNYYLGGAWRSRHDVGTNKPPIYTEWKHRMAQVNGSIYVANLAKYRTDKSFCVQKTVRGMTLL
jgi:GT2 family glycosyltransferase